MDLGTPGSGRLGDHVVDRCGAYGSVRAGALLSIDVVTHFGGNMSSSLPASSTCHSLCPGPLKVDWGELLTRTVVFDQREYGHALSVCECAHP